MKRINTFLEKGPMWQIYIAFWFITGGFTGSLFYVFDVMLATSPELDFSGINCIKIGALSGLLFGLMLTLLISSIRKSQIFWTRADEVEALIKSAETKEGLQSIYENEFQDLRKKCQGGPQIPELNRLYTIMKTKYEYVPQLTNITKEEPKQETPEEAAERMFPASPQKRKLWMEGVNWQAQRSIGIEAYEDSLNMQRASNAVYESKINELKQEAKRMFSEEEVHNILKSYRSNKPKVYLKVFYDEWFEQFKKK